MCLTFFKKFARNNTACPCVLAQFFENVKHYLLNYGRIFTFKFQRFPSRFLCVRVVRCLYVVLLCGLSPLPLLADWTSENTQTLNLIHGLLSTVESNSNSNEYNIGYIKDAIYNNEWGLNQLYRRNRESSEYLNAIKTELANFSNENNYNLYLIYKMLGYSVSSSSTECLAWDLDDIKENLTSIITALDTTNDSLTALNSGLGYTQENTLKDDMQRLINAVNDDVSGDFVKEGTFQSYYDWMRSSLGYEGGSSGSLKDDIFYLKQPSYLTYYTPWFSSYPSTPFPGSTEPWYFPSSSAWDSWTQDSNGSFISDLSFILFQNARSSMNASFRVAQKQAWNDWQAHTNLVSTIVTQADRFFTPPSNDPSPTPSFDASTGQIVTPSTGTGSAGDSFSIQPSFTNDFAVVNQDVNSVTNNFAFVKQKDIEQRYLVDGILESGSFRDYGTVASGFGDVLNLGGMVIDLRSQFENYRKIITIDTINTVRSAFGYIWTFLAIVASFFTVIKISGVSTSSEGE